MDYHTGFYLTCNAALVSKTSQLHFDTVHFKTSLCVCVSMEWKLSSINKKLFQEVKTSFNVQNPISANKINFCSSNMD